MIILIPTFTVNFIHHVNYFYTLDAELAYVTITTEESDIESINLAENIDNGQTLKFQVKFKLFLQLYININI